MLGCLLEALTDLIVEPILRFLILPVMWALATPFVLVGALFGKDGYRDNVRAGYGRVAEVWARLW
jgi:hypothetical protein